MTGHPDLPAGDGDPHARRRELVGAHTRAGAAELEAETAREEVARLRERLAKLDEFLDADADDLDLQARSLADHTVTREEVASRIASVAARLRYYRQWSPPHNARS